MWEVLTRSLGDIAMKIHRESFPNGVILIAGRDKRKSEIVELVKKLLVDAGSPIAVETLDQPGFFSLKCGLIKGMILFQEIMTFFDVYGGRERSILSGGEIESLRTVCEGEHVPFFYIGDEYDRKLVEKWLKTRVLTII